MLAFFLNYGRRVYTIMVNNATNINKTNKCLSSHTIKHKKTMTSHYKNGGVRPIIMGFQIYCYIMIIGLRKIRGTPPSVVSTYNGHMYIKTDSAKSAISWMVHS